VFDRFTLDEVSAKIWWPLAMVALVALVLTVPAANHAADRVRREAAANAIAISSSQIQPLVSSGASVADMDEALSRIQRSNPAFDAVRLWNDQRLLVSSSVQPDTLRRGTAFNDGDINGAISSGSRLVVTDRLPTGDPGPTTVHAYTKIDGQAGPMVTEFEANDAALLAEVHHDWNGYRIVAGAAFLLLLGFALLSMREPVADIGTGVPFYPASLPPNLAIVDAERAVVIEHEDGHARQKVDSLQQRLDESERLRLKAEARLQQALTTLGTGGRNVPGLPPEPPTPTVPPSRQRARRATPSSVEAAASTAPALEAASPNGAVAPSDVPTPPPGAVPDAAAVASTARQKRSSKKRPSKRRREKPAAERTPAPRRSRAEEPIDAPAREVPAVAESAAADAPERVEVVADDVTVSAQTAPGSASAKEARPEVVVLPTEQPSTVGAPTPVAKPAPKPVAKPAPKPVAKPAAAPVATPAPKPDATREEPDAVADALARLAPNGDASTVPLDDPADLRARLARTAALKKPGSRERQDQREALQDRVSEE
jgi:hypothetical protein